VAAATIVLNVTFTLRAHRKPHFRRSNMPLTGPLAPLEAIFDRSARAERPFTKPRDARNRACNGR
jgi:hypothetical protein